MKLRYKISKLATSDLEDIWLYTLSTWSRSQADKYYHSMIKSIELICTHPQIGKSLDEIKKGHRYFHSGQHMIIYKVNNDMIFIDRILHQSMDIESKFI